MSVRKTVIIAAANIFTHGQKLVARELLQIRSLCAALECPAPSLKDS